MADNWYILRDGKRYGPYTGADLKKHAATGHLLPIDLVVKDGMAKPVPAAKVEGLFAASTQGAATPLSVASPSPANAFAFDAGAVPDDTESTGSAGRRVRTAPRFNKVILAAIAGGVLLVILVVTVIFFAGAKQTKDQSATSGAKRQMEERTVKNRAGGADGVSYLERAIKVTGAKANPSVKPAEPGSLQDFFDALGLMCLRMENARIRPGARIAIFFDPPCEASKWHEVFGEPMQLPKGHERIGKVENDFDRWQHKCTDGTLIFQGQM